MEFFGTIQDITTSILPKHTLDEREQKLKTISDNTLTEYLSPTHEFRVKSLELKQGTSRSFAGHLDLALFLVLEGEINIHWSTGEKSCCAVYRPGNSFVIPAKLSEFSIQAKSKSLLYLVDLP